MSGEINVPGAGPVDKRVVIGIGAAIVAFLAWRYWLAGSGAEPVDEAADSGFEDGGTIPGVDGATDWYGSGGGGGSSTGDDTSSTPQQIRTNAQWSQYARDQLLVTDSYTGTAIGAALGNYLAGRPLSTQQQEIVRAAIALAGYPPVGTFVVVPGGDTDVTVAPTGLKVTGVTTTAVTLSWSAVSGADEYRIYRGGVSQNVGTSRDTTGQVGGLQPNTSYTFQVAALSSAGKAGPRSSSVSAKTKAVALAKPATPRVTSVTATTAQVTTNKVSGAQGYNWYINGVAHGHSDAPTYRVVGLRKKTKYSVSVKADTSTQGPGPESARKSFTTKSK